MRRVVSASTNLCRKSILNSNSFINRQLYIAGMFYNNNKYHHRNRYTDSTFIPPLIFAAMVPLHLAMGQDENDEDLDDENLDDENRVDDHEDEEKMDVLMNDNNNKNQRIFANVIIPGIGQPILNGVVIIKHNKIDYVGIVEDELFDANNDIKVNVLMPGLWDAHVHFSGATSKVLKQFNGSFLDLVTLTAPPVAVARCIDQLKTAIRYGITSVREVGGYGLYLKQLVNEGTIIQSPNIYSAGLSLSITGGHGDEHKYPLCFIHHKNERCVGFATLVDGVDQCLLEVRKQIRRGADLIKIHASGGVISTNDNVHHQQFSEEEIACITAEARRTGTIVAAHCHGSDGINAAINNGVYTIEHGTYLTDNLAKKMKEKDLILIPTRWICEYFMKNIDMLPSQESKNKMREVVKQHGESIKIAMEYGVTIAMGTDMGLDEWHQNSKELEYYVNAGMNELDAIQCGTANGPLTLGKYKNIQSGQIKKGYDADLIALSKNPLNDITVLQNEKNIKIVWKGGVILKNITKRNSKP